MHTEVSTEFVNGMITITAIIILMLVVFIYIVSNRKILDAFPCPFTKMLNEDEPSTTI